jgi:hypothetical protein
MSSIIQAAHLELFHEGGFGGRIFKTEELDDPFCPYPPTPEMNIIPTGGPIS